MVSTVICVVLFINFLFDVLYYLRYITTFIFGVIQQQIKEKPIMSPSEIQGIVLTTDLDMQFHMNNARYLREADFGRVKLWSENGIGKAVFMRPGASLTNAANSIRYRKSLQFLNRYRIVTKIIYWDERAFYLETQFLRHSDDFVMAVAISKQSTIGCSPSELIQDSGQVIHRPVLTSELQNLIQSWKLSSENLRKTS